MKLRFAPLAMALAATAFQANAALPDGNILHCYNWPIPDIIEELPAIAKAGFTSVQISPVQGNCNAGAEWYYAYMPFDIKVKQTGVGSLYHVSQLTQAAEPYGIKVIVDVVANHIASGTANHDSFWEQTGKLRFNGSINYSNRYSVTHNQLGGYGDVNSEDAEVQARAVALVEMLKKYGVAGIRWDAAKHIALPSEGCDFWKAVTAVEGLWHYGEILDGPGGPSSTKYTLLQEYNDYMAVTDSEYSNRVMTLIKNGYAPTSDCAWAANGIDRGHIVYWAESHDTYSNSGGTTKNVDQAAVDRAWAVVACRDKETSLYLSRPFEKEYAKIKMGTKGSTHFTEPQIAEVNKFRNAMTGREDAFGVTGKVACITRRGGGAVMVSAAGGNVDITCDNVSGYVPAGVYTDRVSGASFTVTATSISGHIGASGIAVIYQDTESGILDPAATQPMIVSGNYGVLRIDAPEACTVAVTGIDGRTFNRPVEAGMNVITDLPHGFYIVNGTKIKI